MEDNRLDITRAQWKGWIDLITRDGDGIVAQLNSAAAEINAAADGQTSEKWSSLQGPATFGRTYKEYLNAEYKALTQMAQNASDVAQHLDTALQQISNTDSVSETQLNTTIAGLTTSLSGIDAVYESEESKAYWKQYPGDVLSANRRRPPRY